MKKKFLFFAIMLLSVFLTGGCGGNAKDSQDGRTEYRDIMVERKDFPDFQEDFMKDGKQHTLKYLGTQFLGEEPIQLWAERYASEDGSGSIYLWRMDGKRQLLTEGISDDLILYYSWYLDREGSFYLICDSSSEDNLFKKLDSLGNEVFRTDRTDSVTWEPHAICQTSDEKVYLTISETGKGYQLAELDAVTGVVTVLDGIEPDPAAAFGSGIYLGAGVNGPAVCREHDIREADLEKGELRDILLFNGTSYSLIGSGSFEYYEEVQDFRVTGDGSVEILKTNLYGNPAYMERLSLETIQRTTVVLCVPVATAWLKRQVVRFNHENDVYYVVIEEFGGGDGTREEEYQEARAGYAERISIQVATGKGPDILVGDEVLGGNINDMIEKGVLEDLGPYIKEAAFQEEDYYPLVFDAWRRGEEIYGICAEAAIEAWEGDKNVIGADIRETLDNLLAFQEKASYMRGVDSRKLLRMFLEGSETLCGMVDWETGTCDFGGEFFKDLLAVAQRYGDVPQNNYQYIALKVPYLDFYETASSSELENRGLSLAGWMFDDGNHGIVTYGVPIAINSSSDQKEGAWEFLCFLLGDEAQEDAWFFPLKKDTFERWADKQLKRISDVTRVSVSREDRLTGEWGTIRMYEESDRAFLKEEKLPYFRKIVEEARHLPIRPAPVLDIVCEEAEQYFSGNKSAAEVAEVIENRVNLYLNEGR